MAEFGRVDLLHFRCADCAYGASAAKPPRHCPMCGGTRWQRYGRIPASSPFCRAGLGLRQNGPDAKRRLVPSPLIVDAIEHRLDGFP